MQLTTDNVVRFDATGYLEQLCRQSNVLENRYHYSCSHPFILLRRQRKWPIPAPILETTFLTKNAAQALYTQVLRLIPSRAADIQRIGNSYYAVYQSTLFAYTGQRSKREISGPMRFMPREIAASA
jgi:hypothetical protein